MVDVENGIFIEFDDRQLQGIIKEVQNLGLNIKDQGHPADYVGIISTSYEMDPMSSPNAP
jgi:hypothetical protein